MNDERDSIEGEAGAPAPIAGRDVAAPTRRTPRRYLPEPVEAAGFAFQERVLWPLQDRFSLLGPGRNRALLGGGALAVAVAAGAVAVALSSGGGGSPPMTGTVAAIPPPQREQPAETTSEQPPAEAKQPPAPTLHGAKPVFSPPSTASNGGEKTGDSGAAANKPSNGTATSSTARDPSPAGATISSDPSHSSHSGESESRSAAAGADPNATAARAPAPDGPPAGPAALKVAREFAKGFVVYETGGGRAEFKQAFEASATPELTKALLQRPPRQPAGVKVPRAKVLNVVAGPSQGGVYKVSVSLLRVGVTSELRLDMEKLNSKKPKNAEWRVTNVLG